MNLLTKSTWLMTAFLILIISGCASTPKPTSELALAKESIARAKVNNAYDIAPQDISAAESKLAKARNLIEQEKNKEATDLLQQAHKDAQVAMAKVQQNRARSSLDELKESMTELENKLKN